MTRTRLMSIAAGLAASAFVGIAGAAVGPDHAVHTEHNDSVHAPHVVHTTHTDGTHGGQSGKTVEMITIDDGDKYEVIIKNDATVAKVNGIRVADDLVKMKDGKVIILDDNGDVIKELRVARVEGAGQNNGTASWRTEIARAPSAPSAPRVPGVMDRFFSSQDQQNELNSAIAMERPPVMLGVLLEGPGEALQAQLGVSEYAVLIEKVMEGLPADKAGLKKWDIIIEVDGDEIDRPGMLGEILMESEPGDELEFVIVRGGKKIDRTLELAAYDAKKLGVTVSVNTSASPGQGWTLGFENNNRFPGALGRDSARSIEDAMEQLEKLRVFGDDKEAQEKFSEQLAKMQRELASRAEGLRRNQALLLDNKGRLIFNDDDREEMTDALEERLEDLEDQFEDRLESLEDRLEARWEKMEHMLDRMFDKFEQMLDDSRKDRE